MVIFLIKCSNPVKVSLNLKSVSFSVCSHRLDFFPLRSPDAGPVQMPDDFKVDLAPALLYSPFAECYPEPALHHNWATTVFKNPDGSVSPK